MKTNITKAVTRRQEARRCLRGNLGLSAGDAGRYAGDIDKMESGKLASLLKHENKLKRTINEHLKMVGVTSEDLENISREKLLKLIINISRDGAFLARYQIYVLLEKFGFPLEISEEENSHLHEIFNAAKILSNGFYQ